MSALGHQRCHDFAIVRWVVGLAEPSEHAGPHALLSTTTRSVRGPTASCGRDLLDFGRAVALKGASSLNAGKSALYHPIPDFAHGRALNAGAKLSKRLNARTALRGSSS